LRSVSKKLIACFTRCPTRMEADATERSDRFTYDDDSCTSATGNCPWTTSSRANIALSFPSSCRALNRRRARPRSGSALHWNIQGRTRRNPAPAPVQRSWFNHSSKDRCGQLGHRRRVLACERFDSHRPLDMRSLLDYWYCPPLTDLLRHCCKNW
jgi:hypothetical protein